MKALSERFVSHRHFTSEFNSGWKEASRLHVLNPQLQISNSFHADVSWDSLFAKRAVARFVVDVLKRCYSTVPVTLSQLSGWGRTSRHARARDVFRALITDRCRLTSISLPPALFRFSQCQILLLSCWEKLSVSFQHSFASFSLIYHRERSCLLWKSLSNAETTGHKVFKRLLLAERHKRVAIDSLLLTRRHLKCSKTQSIAMVLLLKSGGLSWTYTNYSWVRKVDETNISVCVFAVQEMEERIRHFDTFLWAGPVGRSWSARDHKDTQTELRMTQKNMLGQAKSGALPPHPPGGTAFQLRTFIGAIVSGTWLDPDPFCITKLLEVRQSHMRTHPRGVGRPLVLHGCLPLSMLLARPPKSHD